MYTDSSESGATHVDRELITGDSPAAANALGKLAAPLLVAAWTKTHWENSGKEYSNTS